MPTNMPDVASSAVAPITGTLDWVGMSNIELPLMVKADDGLARPVSAKAGAFVNLAVPKAKGIHMSRLYLALDKLSLEQEVTPSTIQALLDEFVGSHDGLSDRAQIKLQFDYHMRRPALMSGNQGWRNYPVTITGRLDQGLLSLELEVEVAYSSTCPCSAALARQLIQEAFDHQFHGQDQVDAEVVHKWLGSTQGIVATPHSQRSVAEVKVMLDSQLNDWPILLLVETIENALQTPVQAAVKREDEQEFTRLNGQNLMFVEDSARRLKQALLLQENFEDFWLRVNHLESLHAHDAVAVDTKGIEGGYQAF